VEEHQAAGLYSETTMTLVVITDQDIYEATPLSIRDCPVAKAVSRAFGRPMVASPGMISDGQCMSFLPSFVSNWMVNFDKGNPVPRIWFYV
jgi:hypothetical protein